jgi:hypothetical protein
LPTVIANPILNSPFREPTRPFRFDEDGITNTVVDERPRSTFFIPIPKLKKKVSVRGRPGGRGIRESVAGGDEYGWYRSASRHRPVLRREIFGADRTEVVSVRVTSASPESQEGNARNDKGANRDQEEHAGRCSFLCCAERARRQPRFVDRPLGSAAPVVELEAHHAGHLGLPTFRAGVEGEQVGGDPDHRLPIGLRERRARAAHESEVAHGASAANRY